MHQRYIFVGFFFGATKTSDFYEKKKRIERETEKTTVLRIHSITLLPCSLNVFAKHFRLPHQTLTSVFMSPDAYFNHFRHILCVFPRTGKSVI